MLQYPHSMSSLVDRPSSNTPRPLSEGTDPTLPLVNPSQKQLELIEHAISVLSGISRTFKGESNTDSSAEKLSLRCAGDELKDRARQNFRHTIIELFSHAPRSFSCAAAVREFVVETAQNLNRDLTRDGVGFFRTWDTTIPIHTPKELVAEEFGNFCEELYLRIGQDKVDSIELAAWIEWRFNARIHPLADGCGRTSRALSTYFLGLGQIPLPPFTDREEYFEKINLPFEEWLAYYTGHIPKQ